MKADRYLVAPVISVFVLRIRSFLIKDDCDLDETSSIPEYISTGSVGFPA